MATHGNIEQVTFVRLASTLHVANQTGEAVSEMTLLKNMVRRSRVSDEAYRKKHPYGFLPPNSNVLYIENVARLLACSIGKVRHIPKRELPAARIGRRSVYLREDVEEFIRKNRDFGQGPKVNARAGRSKPTMKEAIDFDPVAMAKAPKKDRRGP